MCVYVCMCMYVCLGISPGRMKILSTYHIGTYRDVCVVICLSMLVRPVHAADMCAYTCACLRCSSILLMLVNCDTVHQVGPCSMQYAKCAHIHTYVGISQG